MPMEGQTRALGAIENAHSGNNFVGLLQKSKQHLLHWLSLTQTGVSPFLNGATMACTLVPALRVISVF